MKRKILSLLFTFPMLFGAVGCSKNSGTSCNCSCACPSDSSVTSDSSAVHQHVYDQEVANEQYLATAANCEEAAKYYKSCTCGEHSEETFTYGEPLGHLLGEYIRRVEPTYDEDGMIGHYECERCHTKFDSNKNPVAASDLKINKFSVTHNDIIDEILAPDAIKSSWDAIVNNVNKWNHDEGSHFLTVPNNAGWQLSKSQFTDIQMTLRINGAGNLNPDVGYITKSFLIGAKRNPGEKVPGEGEYGRYPVGYVINVSSATYSGTAGIYVYYWDQSKIDTISGLKLVGRVAGNFNNVDFNIRVQGKTLSILDEDGRYMLIDMGTDLTKTMTTCDLDYYEGGSIGVFSWTTTKTGEQAEPTSSKFYINDFSGREMDDVNTCKSVGKNILSEGDSIKSTNAKVLSNVAKWSQGATSNVINTNNSYDADAAIGSWQLDKNSYDNVEVTFSIKGATTTNPYSPSKPSCKSVLFGAQGTGDYFTGYSATIYNNGKTDYWIQIHYHNNSVIGEFVGGVYGNFDGVKLTLRIQNNYLHIFKENGAELCGGDYWAKKSQGVYLDHYSAGHIGILNWDSTVSTFTFHNVKDLRDEMNADYSAQNSAKRVNVFVLAGQSNAEGNTRAYDNIDSSNYLRNYCNASTHSYAELMTGYDNIKISVHNHYTPQREYYKFTNAKDPMMGKFVPTKVGYGLRNNNYMGPEVGFAEKLNANHTGNPIYIIKYTSGGTAFESNVISWRSQSTISPAGYLYLNMVQYVKNCLSLIVKEGFIPVVKGLMWMQGESDASSEAFGNKYLNNLTNMVYDFKSEFATYAVNNDGSKINFIDAEVFAGATTQCKFPAIVNNAKNSLANSDSYNYCINTNASGYNCEPGTGVRYGGGDGWHYSVDSMITLGNAYADVVLNNHILDF